MKTKLTPSKCITTRPDICREAGDAGSKDLFESLLHDEERHADFLEAQLHSIKELGLGHYFAQQLLNGK